MDKQLTRSAFGLPRSSKGPGAASLSLPVGREPSSIASGLHPLPGLLSPLRVFSSFYDSFSKGTNVPRGHVYDASTPLRLIKSDPCTAGADCTLAGRHPRPFLPLSPAGGHCALKEKATSLNVFSRWMNTHAKIASKATKSPSVRQGYTSCPEQPLPPVGSFLWSLLCNFIMFNLIFKLCLVSSVFSFSFSRQPLSSVLCGSLLKLHLGSKLGRLPSALSPAVSWALCPVS